MDGWTEVACNSSTYVCSRAHACACAREGRSWGYKRDHTHRARWILCFHEALFTAPKCVPMPKGAHEASADAHDASLILKSSEAGRIVSTAPLAGLRLLLMLLMSPGWGLENHAKKQLVAGKKRALEAIQNVMPSE